MTDPDDAQARVLIAAVRGRAEIDLVSVGFIRPYGPSSVRTERVGDRRI